MLTATLWPKGPVAWSSSAKPDHVFQAVWLASQAQGSTGQQQAKCDTGLWAFQTSFAQLHSVF